MTTDKQLAANKANALKSTGPTSKKGKAAASKNALKHGLSLPPEFDNVTRWYRIIKNDLDATPDPGDANRLNQVAFALAQAEAARERATAAEAMHLATKKPVAPRTMLQFIEQLVAAGPPDLDDPAVLAFLRWRSTDPVEREGLKIMRDIALEQSQRKAKTASLKQLMRYRRAAEAGRHKTLVAFCATLEAQKSENEPILSYK